MIARITSLASVIAICLLLSGCGSSSEKTQTQKPSLLIVNVLDPEFAQDALIAGSINVPLLELKEKAEGWDKSVPVVTYCSNYACTASHMAAQWLQEMGFIDARVYEGGVAEWYQLGKADAASYPLVGPAQQPYLTAENKKFAEPEVTTKAITAQELSAKMQHVGLIKKAPALVVANMLGDES